jgi:hypothetical protein
MPRTPLEGEMEAQIREEVDAFELLENVVRALPRGYSFADALEAVEEAQSA